MRKTRVSLLIAALAVGCLLVTAAAPGYAADTGRVRIWATTVQAQIFIDGRSVDYLNWQGRAFKLSPGEHEIGVYNYGYKPSVQKVNIVAGQDTKIHVDLTPVPGNSTGPWGRIQIESGHGQYGPAAVLLNGKTPDYLVGHSDMFNNDIIWKQELLVPPGKHHVLITRDGQTLYEGDVTVAANQRVIIHPSSNQVQTTDWPRGAKLGNSLPRFKAGIASTTVAVAPVAISSFSATPGQINCLDSSRLEWKTAEAVDVTLDGNKVDTSGQQLVSPHANTTYKLVAMGPGGEKDGNATVNVNSGIDASISVSPDTITYHRIGNKVVEHGTANLTWSTSNADTVNIDPLGSVSASGTRSVQPTPQQTSVGPVNENAVYSLHATNPCGGDETRTASLHITGSIDPLPEVVLQSVFFPTDYPDARHPNAGLLASQKHDLSLLADGFKKYMEFDPDAKLRLEANADARNSVKYNQALGERRAAIVKQFLVDQGIPSANIDSVSFGEEQNLEKSTVKSLEAQNPNQPPKKRLRASYADWLAYNRRVDVVLQPSGQRSLRYYPHNADDSNILWQVPKPGLRSVEKHQ